MPLVALDNVSFQIAEGQFVCLLGPSGCGKSTLLSLFAGLFRPSKGEVVVLGESVRRTHPRVGLVQQQDNLFPWRSLRSNVRLGLELRRMSTQQRTDRAQAWIDRVGLTGFENAYPHQLSGGMRQRANIARTLAIDPTVLLMDEPFGALDAMTRAELQGMLEQLLRELKKTVLFVTHDIVEAITLADRIIVMSARPGSIRADEPVDLPRPRDPFSIQEHPAFAPIHKRVLGHVLLDTHRHAPALRTTN